MCFVLGTTCRCRVPATCGATTAWPRARCVHTTSLASRADSTDLVGLPQAPAWCAPRRERLQYWRQCGHRILRQLSFAYVPVALQTEPAPPRARFRPSHLSRLGFSAGTTKVAAARSGARDDTGGLPVFGHGADVVRSIRPAPPPARSPRRLAARGQLERHRRPPPPRARRRSARTAAERRGWW